MNVTTYVSQTVETQAQQRLCVCCIATMFIGDKVWTRVDMFDAGPFASGIQRYPERSFCSKSCGVRWSMGREELV